MYVLYILRMCILTRMYIEPSPGRTYTCTYAVCTICTCEAELHMQVFFFFLFFSFFFFFSDSRLAVVQPGIVQVLLLSLAATSHVFCQCHRVLTMESHGLSGVSFVS